MKNTLIELPSGDWILPSSILAVVLRFSGLEEGAKSQAFVHVVYRTGEPYVPCEVIFDSTIKIPVATAEDGWAMIRRIVMDMGVTEKAPELPGLSVKHHADGCWMTFQASNGNTAGINLTMFANERGGGLITATILQWIEDVKPIGT